MEHSGDPLKRCSREDPTSRAVQSRFFSSDRTQTWVANIIGLAMAWGVHAISVSSCYSTTAVVGEKTRIVEEMDYSQVGWLKTQKSSLEARGVHSWTDAATLLLGSSDLLVSLVFWRRTFRWWVSR